MIHYSLRCENAHDFDAWFASGEDFDKQLASHYVTCPSCNSVKISKSLMAPNVSTGRSKDKLATLAMDAKRVAMMAKLKEVVADIRTNAEDVGEKFPEEARKIHYGESEVRGIMGQASFEEAQALIEEGIEIAPLPILPDDVN